MTMSKRNCSSCGHEKELRGGRVCERGHFICKSCVEKGSDWLFSRKLSKCPLCGSKLS